MSTSARITVDATELLALIDRAIAELEHPRQLMDDIGALLESNARVRFTTKTDPAGVPWPPLAPATVNHWYAIKYPQGIPGTLLQRTGQLFDSIGHNPGDDWVELGTSRRVPGKRQPFWEVGELHEWGTVIMPRRGIFTADPKTGKLGADDEADVLDLVERAMLGAFD